jgi:hypothetical protein
MKYLKHILQDKAIKNLIAINTPYIESIDLKEFQLTLANEIHTNLITFIDESNTNTYLNIKKFALEKTLSYMQEVSIMNTIGFGATVGVGTALYMKWKELTDYVTSFWSPLEKITSPTKITIDVNDGLKEKLGNLTKAIEEPHVKVEFLQMEPQHFYNTPMLTLAAIVSVYLTSSQLLNEFNNISKIANLKTQLEQHFDRLTSLGYSEARQFKDLNISKYEESINKCQDKSAAFGVFTINLSCPLDAFLMYCASMIISMGLIYISKVGIGKVDNMRSLLATKDEFIINQMLTNNYNLFCFSVDYIFKDLPGMSTKWKTFIDTGLTKAPVVNKPHPQVTSQSSYNSGSKPAYSPNQSPKPNNYSNQNQYVRQSRPVN